MGERRCEENCSLKYLESNLIMCRIKIHLFIYNIFHSPIIDQIKLRNKIGVVR